VPQSNLKQVKCSKQAGVILWTAEECTCVEGGEGPGNLGIRIYHRYGASVIHLETASACRTRELAAVALDCKNAGNGRYVVEGGGTGDPYRWAPLKMVIEYLRTYSAL
jgi:hypothetical protein